MDQSKEYQNVAIQGTDNAGVLSEQVGGPYDKLNWAQSQEPLEFRTAALLAFDSAVRYNSFYSTNSPC